MSWLPKSNSENGDSDGSSSLSSNLSELVVDFVEVTNQERNRLQERASQLEDRDRAITAVFTNNPAPQSFAFKISGDARRETWMQKDIFVCLMQNKDLLINFTADVAQSSAYVDNVVERCTIARTFVLPGPSSSK